jgi:hypothetical protein
MQHCTKCQANCGVPSETDLSQLAMLSAARSQLGPWTEFAKRDSALATIVKNHNF